MKNRTVTVTVPADRDDVFRFLAELSNLPIWASESFQRLRYEEDGCAKVWTPTGEVFVALMVDESTGVIDLMTGSARRLSLIQIGARSTTGGAGRALRQSTGFFD